jgi:hypothetical protein
VDPVGKHLTNKQAESASFNDSIRDVGKTAGQRLGGAGRSR